MLTESTKDKIPYEGCLKCRKSFRVYILPQKQRKMPQKKGSRFPRVHKKQRHCSENGRMDKWKHLLIGMIKVYKFLQKKDRFNAMNEKDRENSS